MLAQAMPQPDYASFRARVAAYLVDLVLLTVLESVPQVFLVGAAVSVVMEDIAASPRTLLARLFALEALVVLVSTVIAALYFVGFWMWRGQTPGKMLVGIRVLRADGSPLNLRTALYRYFIGYGVSFLTLGLGFLAVAFHPRKQGWHDRVSHTVVVRSP